MVVEEWFIWTIGLITALDLGEAIRWVESLHCLAQIQQAQIH